jgi:hypothetical protein
MDSAREHKFAFNEAISFIVPCDIKRTPMSRPFLGRNKLRTGGSDFCGAAGAAPPFRRLSRRSGRTSALPYPPLKCIHCNPVILAPKR